MVGQADAACDGSAEPGGGAVIPAALLVAMLQAPPVRHIVILPRTCHVARVNGAVAARGEGVLTFTTTGAATVSVGPCGITPTRVGGQ